jgi:hypothetical protein
VWEAANVTDQPRPGATTDSRLTPEFVKALTAELAKKSDLLWVSVDAEPAQAVWHVWHDDAVCLVTDGLEQRNPGLIDGGTAELVLRSRDNFSRMMRVSATVVELDPSTEAWEAAAAALHPKRLNPPDGEEQPNRWRSESHVWLLRPTDQVEEAPTALSDDSHREVPRPTTATTRGRMPFHAGRATKKRR